MKVGHLTLGCKANSYDTDSILSAFEQKGYEIVRDHSPADIYVINTCSVTNVAERKSRQAIERVLKLNPDAIIVVTGCYAQVKPHEAENLKNVAVVCGTRDRKHIVELTEEYIKQHNKGLCVTENTKNYDFEDIDVISFDDKTRVQLKIQDGCDNFCSYCIIPYARGRACSKPVDRVLEQVKYIASKGYKEIVLTGIHIASYGKDLKDCDLAKLISLIHDATEGTNVRIRLGSLDPRVVTEDFVKTVSKLERFCPQFHLSLQSGSNTVLQRMNRKYTAEEYANGVCLLRQYFAAPSITTDVITGFPGETDEEFAETLEFAKKIGFAKIHIFPYSKREGTVAAKMPNQVPHSVAVAREKALDAVQAQTGHDYISSFIGKTVSVLIEEEKVIDDKKYLCGYTPEYVYVRAEGDNTLCNTIVNVKIHNAGDSWAEGNII